MISVPHSSQTSHPLSHSIDCVTNSNDAILAYLKLILVRMMSACYPIHCTRYLWEKIKRMNINNYCLNWKLIHSDYGSLIKCELCDVID